MQSDPIRPLNVLAPAKINLYLHITGQREDGYHLLDSLVAFVDIGDEILIEPAQDFSLKITGPFAGSFTASDRDASPDSSNLISRAVWNLSRAAQKIPNIKITLTKNLPLASGLGGGSSDAAATLWGLLEWWKIPTNAPYLEDLMLQLGSDVPVCLTCQSSHMTGIGDILNPLQSLPETPILLVNPGTPCQTDLIFQNYSKPYQSPITMPESFDDSKQLVDFLAAQTNDLTESAVEVAPQITQILSSLDQQKGCLLSRMSGSGATCFGLFNTKEDVMDAAEHISCQQPSWWVRAGTLGTPERY